MINHCSVSEAVRIRLEDLFERLPEPPALVEGIRRAPKRHASLTRSDLVLALKNALRYLPPHWHARMAPEFLDELLTRGRIYGYRFRPPGRIRGRSVDSYRGNCIEGRAFQVMIDNNLDFEVALYPYELVTYGETGQVCQNWMQYHLIGRYLEQLTRAQTLVVASGHPLGMFASGPDAPRVIITNALMVGAYDNLENWARAAALGVANYGQMTAGGWMYIGPQGIVHGTYSTLLNAARLKLGLADDGDLSGRLFVSSGLGGMSGAQGKAVEIAGGVGIIAEVDPSRIQTRYKQGWVGQVVEDPADAFRQADAHRRKGGAAAIAFRGNIVDLLDYAAAHHCAIDLLTDQTSCHAVYDGGYCPQGLTFAERTEMLRNDPGGFAQRVDASLARHFTLIEALVERGAYFFDYGNSFLKAVFDAGVTAVCRNGQNPNDGFVFPSYVEDIMGPLLFDYGYGPFRWVCLSGKPEDLRRTDQAALACIDPDRRFQDRDNHCWIARAEKKQAGGRHPGPHPLPGCPGAHEDRLEIQQPGTQGGDRSGHARPGPPRHRGDRLPLQRDGQHPGREQHHGGDGRPVLCRQRGPGDEPGGPAQRRWGGHRQGRQRRVRTGARRQPTRGCRHPAGDPLGRHGRRGSARLGPEPQRPGDGGGVQSPAPGHGPHHAPFRGRRPTPHGPGRRRRTGKRGW